MDEKELVKRIRNSFRAKKSRAEILGGFQKRGYKLDYADKLIAKAKRPKQVTIIFLITFIIFSIIVFSVNTIFFNQQKIQNSNPSLGFIIADSEVALSSQDKQSAYNQIKINTDFISFLLQKFNVTEYLHSNFFEKPIINFKIGTETFYSEIGTEIKTHEGLNKNADLQFDINRQNLIDAIFSSNPEQIFRNSITSGNTQVEFMAGKIELGSKGYLRLYEILNSPLPL